MESSNQTPRFCYHFGDSEGEIEYSGILEIYAHHARNIHNICIYDNQDVFAKFSLTYTPDDMVSTQVIIGGGKNPDFNEKLALNVSQVDAAVLKCEIWMQSRAKNLMEDQLLGFALVPISQIISQGGKIICRDFSLSSTDLFHSPAGIVQLSLTLSSNRNNSYVFPSFSAGNSNLSPNLSGRNSSITSEVVLLNPNDHSSVEFPDVNADTEDQMIISGYLNSNSNHSLGSFLHLGSLLKIEEDVNDHDDEMTGVSEERSTSDQIGNEIETAKNTGQVSTDFEIEQTAMQQQIVDMYMKSMHQFTESLAKMKLPMDLNPNPSPNPNPDVEENGNMIQILERNSNLEVENKKDSSRVFYGSRAFF